MKIQSLVIGALIAATAVPASAVLPSSLRVVNLINAPALNGTNATSLVRNVNNTSFTAVGRSAANVLPDSLTLLSQISTARDLRLQTNGTGVAGGGDRDQVDTNLVGRREGILLTSSTAKFRLTALVLSIIDVDDTLQVYGVQGTSLINLGYPGVISSTGPNAAIGLLNGQATGGQSGGTPFITQTLNLVNPTGYYSGYFFTTRAPGDTSFLGSNGQGYRITSLTLSVPEPATWTMLVVGFGLVGLARRRRTVVAA